MTMFPPRISMHCFRTCRFKGIMGLRERVPQLILYKIPTIRGSSRNNVLWYDHILPYTYSSGTHGPVRLGGGVKRCTCACIRTCLLFHYVMIRHTLMRIWHAPIIEYRVSLSLILLSRTRSIRTRRSRRSQRVTSGTPSSSSTRPYWYLLMAQSFGA